MGSVQNRPATSAHTWRCRKSDSHGRRDAAAPASAGVWSERMCARSASERRGWRSGVR